MNTSILMRTKVMLLAALGLLLLVTAGCYGRGLYGFSWGYCKFFGYPGVFGCIKPPPADSTLLPTVPFPISNPQSKEKEQLGMKLFFDPRLSKDGSISCSSCHQPGKGFADGRQFSKGVGDAIGTRNAPTVLNTAYHRHLFWDGRAGSLEEQAKGPHLNPIEMGNKSMEVVVARLKGFPDYQDPFRKAFPPDGQITEEHLLMAIATYERSLISMDSPFERWVRETEPMPSKSAERGWRVFGGKARCANCHVPPTYTDDAFHHIGVTPHPPGPDALGLDGFLSKHPDYEQGHGKFRMDKCAFKTPSLLNIADTAPYMHNGSMNTLEEVVSFYVRGGDPVDTSKCSQKDWRMVPLMDILDVEDQKDLVEFLKSLTGKVPPSSLP